MTWSANPDKTHHEGFEKPIYAWVPSIGTSQLIVLRGKAFRQWAGDVMVSSLVAQTLFRIRLAEGHAVVVEPIPIGHRIRDLVELSNGAIALKTDDDFLVFLEPVDAASLTELEAEARGKVSAARCAGCHSLAPDGADGIGPALWGIVRRDVASRKGFAYSPALASMGGTWTRDRLRAFISKPDSVAPGTRMEFIANLRFGSPGRFVGISRDAALISAPAGEQKPCLPSSTRRMSVTSLTGARPIRPGQRPPSSVLSPVLAKHTLGKKVLHDRGLSPQPPR